MEIKTVHLVYYSATGNTQTVARAIGEALAQGLNAALCEVDFTLPAARQAVQTFGPGDLVVAATPVYAGRVPNKMLPYVQEKLVGGGALAVPALSILFGASDLIARGTSLLAMFPNSITTSVANMKRNLVHVKAALIIGLVAAVTAPLGTWIAGEVSPRVGAIMFACYLCVLLVRSVFVAVKATRAARVARG